MSTEEEAQLLEMQANAQLELWAAKTAKKTSTTCQFTCPSPERREAGSHPKPGIEMQ